MNTYTPEQIEQAVVFYNRTKAVEREKYERNKAQRLAYAKEYYTNNKAAILARNKARRATTKVEGGV